MASINEPEKEAEPTAMEIALREAMEKAKARKQEDKARKSKGHFSGTGRYPEPHARE